MKNVKRFLALLLAAAMVMGMSLAAMAQEVSLGNGPATIEIENTTPEQTYSVKKVFDATANADGDIAYFLLDSNGNRITDAADMPQGFDTYFNVDAAGNITPKDAVKSPSDATKLSDEAIEWLKANSTVVDGSSVEAGTDGTLKYTGLEYGYYVVTSTLGDALVTVTSTAPNAKIIDKNQVSSWEDGGKKIVVVGEDGAETTVNTKDLAIGDTVTYRLTINAVNYEGTKQVKDYTVSDDLPEGMTFGEITKVTVTEADGTVASMSDAYKDITADDDGKFSLVITWAEDEDGVWTSKYNPNAVITIEYTATLNDKAVIAGSGNENKANFKPSYTDGTEPEGEKPDATTKVYTTSLTILKQDEEENVLTGAEFTITGESVKTVVTSGDVFVEDPDGTYYKLKDGTYTTTAPTPEMESRYEDTQTKYKKESTVTLDTTEEDVEASGFVDSEGKVVFEGLCAGTYTVSETVVPAGYNKVADITFVISQEVDEDTKTITYTATKDGEAVETEDNTFEITVINNKGVELPSTGGAGTTLFYIIGSILVIGAGIVLVAKRRMSVR